MRRRFACVFLALLLLLCAFPAFALDDSEQMQEDEAARERIREMCEVAKEVSGRKSFKGYCGAYINQLMMAYGLNTEYVKGNGNQIFDNYKNLDVSTGGYSIFAYDCREYTLEEALLDISARNEIAHNVVIGFTRSPSEAGKKYGHCVYIDTIMHGVVYYSESFNARIDGERVEAGEPIVRTIEEFLDYYKKYKLDGVLYFTMFPEVMTAPLPELSIPDISVEDAVELEGVSVLSYLTQEE